MRPDYAESAIDEMLQLAGVQKGDRVCDVGGYSYGTRREDQTDVINRSGLFGEVHFKNMGGSGKGGLFNVYMVSQYKLYLRYYPRGHEEAFEFRG